MSFGTQFLNGVQGFIKAYLSAGEPQKAALPKGSPPSQFDFSVRSNIQTMPRADAEITFEQLRMFADGYDLLRLAIEKRKDQIEAMDWNITAIDKTDPVARAQAEKLYKQLRRPDGVHSFSRWMRSIVEDVLVIDAPAIYIRRNIAGHIHALELVDGATIKVNITDEGRTPAPPLSAYQQIIDGVPAVDLTTDELLYFPRNVRSHKLYGLSKVEQVIMTVNLALNRQMYQLDYYTQGTIPEAFLSCPSDWSVDQIGAFQSYWDALFEGDSKIKRKARFVPAGINPIFPKDSPMKDEFDEWLARIISYALDLPPTALVKETNRATAETTQAASQDEGQRAFLNYLKEIMDILLHDYFDVDGVEFVWATKEEVEPLKQAQIDQMYVNLRILTPSEVRSRLGYDPLTEEQAEEFAALTPQQIQLPALFADGSALQKTDAPSAKKRDAPTREDMQQQFAAAIRRMFDKVKPDLLRQLENSYAKAMAQAEKLDAKKKKKLLQTALDDLDFDGWTILFDDAAECLEEIAKAGAYEGLRSIKASTDGITDIVDADAQEWARARAAELVGKKWNGKEFVDNPNPKWAITESTREVLRGTVSKAIDEGWSPQKLTATIRDDQQFWARRADMISRTELQFAHQNGNLIGWKASGIVAGKQSLCIDGGCEMCVENAEAGTVGIDENFPSGHDAPPYHPNCFCTLIPVLAEDMTDDES